MKRFLLLRLRQTLILLFLLSVLIFGLFSLIPGDYLDEMSLNPAVSPQRVDALRREFGLDQPPYIQYFRWLREVLRGNLGYSFSQQRPAASLIVERFWTTFLLSGAALAIVVLLTFFLGIGSALRPSSWFDRTGLVMTLMGLSLSPLILSLGALYFAFASGWFPVGGFESPKSLILPALVLAIPPSAYLTRQLRLELIDALRQPFVWAAAARGLPPHRVVLHALREALNPMISLLGMTWGGLLSGSVVVERVFGIPGLGSLMVQSILYRDLFVALNALLLSSFLIIVVNLAADLMLAWNDPRIRYA